MKLSTRVRYGSRALVDLATHWGEQPQIIKDIARGGQPVVEVLMAPGTAAKALAEFEAVSALGEPLRNLLAHLSPREADILKRIGEGNTIEQVAVKLTMTEETIRHQLKLVVQKLVANDQARAMIEAVQRSLPSILSGAFQARPAGEYVTKQEFTEFKDTLIQTLKSLIGEKSLPKL